MKERLDFNFLPGSDSLCEKRCAAAGGGLCIHQNPFMRLSITHWNTFCVKSNYSGRSALPGPWIGLHAYCAGSMVKFKLGWLVKLRGAFCSVCRGGRSPSLISPRKTRHWSRAVTASPLLCSSATKNVQVLHFGKKKKDEPCTLNSSCAQKEKKLFHSQQTLQTNPLALTI